MSKSQPIRKLLFDNQLSSRSKRKAPLLIEWYWRCFLEFRLHLWLDFDWFAWIISLSHQTYFWVLEISYHSRFRHSLVSTIFSFVFDEYSFSNKNREWTHQENICFPLPHQALANVQNLMSKNTKMESPKDTRSSVWMDHFMFTNIAFTIQNFFTTWCKDRISEAISLSPNAFPMFRYFTWRSSQSSIGIFTFSQHYRETLEMDLDYNILWIESLINF